MATLKIIKTKVEHQVAIKELENLLDINPVKGTPEADRLELLTLLVEAYESKTFSFDAPDPIEAIEFRMDQQNLSPRDLIPFIGSRSKVSETLSRKRPLTLSMIRALHDGLGIPAKALIQQSTEPQLQSGKELDWNRFPLREMISRGWIGDSLNAVRAFFAHTPAPAQQALLYRKSDHIRSVRTMNEYALTAWTTRIFMRAQDEVLPPYKKGSVTLSFMQELAKCSTLKQSPLEAKIFLSKHGIPLIIEPQLPHTYLDGAALLASNNRPIIGMTLRHDRIDNFWFTLMHELAHVALHFGEESIDFIDDLDIDDLNDPKEREADELAGESLIPTNAWGKSPASKLRSPQAALHLANQLKIHPAIVAGRMRHKYNDFRMLNKLVGHREVRRLFQDIKWGD